MILDKGTCTVYSIGNSASAGSMPVETMTKRYESWYAELDFETNPTNPTEWREEVVTDARIRVIQNRTIVNKDAIKLSPEPDTWYEVMRVFHGVDDENGELISDISLRKVE